MGPFGGGDAAAPRQSIVASGSVCIRRTKI
jgi:hypothetical protein